MSPEIAANARRSSLISTYGVGSILPASDESVMILGLEEWPDGGPEVPEPRLAEALGVRTLRGPTTKVKSGDVPAVRFPDFAFCSDCRRLGPHWTLRDMNASGAASRRCDICQTGSITPSRFVVCCERGHIADFPYHAWVHEQDQIDRRDHSLKLVTEGHSSALGDLIVTCSCRRSRSMAEAFSFGAFKGIRRCHGDRPWLQDREEGCEEQLRTLQRGSSNVWFGVTASSLSIPSPKNRARAFVEKHFNKAKKDADPTTLASLYDPPEGCTTADLITAIIHMQNPPAAEDRPTEEDLRAEEYRALVNGLTTGPGSDQFLCEELDLTGSDLPTVVTQLSRVGRLREVRALRGFSRVKPTTGGEDSPPMAPLSKTPPTWLPAMEVLGEGIFLRLDVKSFDDWATGDFARSRVSPLLRVADNDGSLTDGLAVTAKSVAMHSLAHILIDELSLTSGYPAASLRERIYDEGDQTGILIYTASSDSAGSLGGLAAQSTPDRFNAVLNSAARRAEWCTTDPVCIESTNTGLNGMNNAACHACLLVPETSCERFNVTLDRALLTGTPEKPADGLLSKWLDGGY